jgi:septal ring factor EnvC (AmiA/AmiB activator)
LQREVDGLRTQICCLRRELENKDRYTGKLKYLVHERSERVDELNAKLQQSREQVRRLDQENDHLVEIIRSEWRIAQECFAPPLDAAMLAPK